MSWIDIPVWARIFILIFGYIGIALVVGAGMSYAKGCRRRLWADRKYPEHKIDSLANDWDVGIVLSAIAWVLVVPIIASFFAFCACVAVLVWIIEKPKWPNLFRWSEELGNKHGCGPKK